MILAINRLVRKIIVVNLINFTFIIGLASAAVPGSVDYQAYLADSSGSPINGSISITFSLYDVDSGGLALWSDTQSVTPINGLFSVKLGSPANPFPAGLFDAPVYIGISVAADGEMVPRIALSSAGFAHKADDAESLQGQSASSLDQSAHVTDMSNPHSVNAAQIGAASSADLGLHAGDINAHHSKTISFSEILDQAADVQLPASITRDSELTTHAGVADVHHPRYSDAEAVSAMGVISDGNPLRHNKFTSAEALAAAISLLSGQVCPPGKAVIGFGIGGQVMCEGISSFTDFLVDSSGGTGIFSSPEIAIASDGFPIIVYHNDTSGEIRVAHCADVTCSSLDVSRGLSPTGGVGARSISVTIGADGLPVISFIRGNNIFVVHCGDVRCANETLYSENIVVMDNLPGPPDTVPIDTNGQMTKIVIAHDGYPVIVYSHETVLYVAHCVDILCSDSVGEPDPESAPTGYYIDPNSTFDAVVVANNVVIAASYFEEVSRAYDLRFGNTLIDAGQAGKSLSLSLGIDGNPIIAYLSEPANTLRVAHCNDEQCLSAVDITVIDSDIPQHQFNETRLVINKEGKPLVTYAGNISGVPTRKVLRCWTPRCSSGVTINVFDKWQGNTESDMVIGADGLPLITYTGSGAFNGDIYVARCGNASCTP